MFFAAYEAGGAGTTQKGSRDWVRPLGVAPVTPLPSIQKVTTRQEEVLPESDLLL